MATATVTEEGSKTDRDNSNDANHGGEGGRVDVALPQQLPPPDAATDGSDTAEDTDVLSLVLQRMSGSESPSIPTELPGILVDAKMTERDLLLLSLGRNLQLEQYLKAPDVEQEESAECASPPSPALRAAAGPTEADGTNSFKNSDVLSILLQHKKESSTDPKSKAPAVISTLEPKLRDMALTEGVLELALDRIGDWARVAKSRQERIQQLEKKMGAKKVKRGPHRQIGVNSPLRPGEYFPPPAAGGPLPSPGLSLRLSVFWPSSFGKLVASRCRRTSHSSPGLSLRLSVSWPSSFGKFVASRCTKTSPLPGVFLVSRFRSAWHSSSDRCYPQFDGNGRKATRPVGPSIVGRRSSR